MPDEPGFTSGERDDVGGRPVHVPVLLDTVAATLRPALAGGPRVLVDATLGLAGHSLALLAEHPELTVIGIDRDQQALDLAAERVAAAGCSGRVHLVHAVYDDIAAAVASAGWSGAVHGVLFDLGVSSLQLDQADRGFAYAIDAPLDMRMDPTDGLTAADVLNTYSLSGLTNLLRNYGEERFAGRIASALVRERVREPFTRSARLVEVIRDALPAAVKRTGGHPAKRTFQGLRIEVNDELGALRRAIPAALSELAVGGRMIALSYHSLEDRIVKTGVAPLARSLSPVGLPVDLPGSEPEVRWLTRGVQTPTDAEIAQNPRAASARMRAVERIRPIRKAWQ